MSIVSPRRLNGYTPSRKSRPTADEAPPPPARTAPANPPPTPRVGPTLPATPPPATPITARVRSPRPPKEPHGTNGEPELTEVYQFSVTTEEELAETIFDPSQDPALVYAICPADGKVYTSPSLVSGNTLYLLPPDYNNLIAKGVVLFPSAATEYGSDSHLISSMRAYVHRYADIPEFWEKVICYYAMMTWVFDRFSAVGYLRALGEYQSGKSRIAQVAASLCYRVLLISGASSPAAMYRSIEMFHGTLAVDEADFRGSELWTEIAKVFNCGYKPGNPIMKCDSDNRPETFDVFCPKVLSTRTKFDDQATESRCLTMMVVQKKPRKGIPYQLPISEFKSEAQELRNKLLMWRFRNYRRIAITEEIESKLSGLDSRYIEILAPLMAVSAADSGFHTELKDVFDHASKEQRANSQQALIVEAIRDLMGKASSKVLRVKDVAQRASELLQQQEPDAVREAAKVAGKGHGEAPLTYPSRKAGHWIRSVGFTTEKPSSIGFVFEVTAEKWKEVSERYPPPPVPGRCGTVPSE